jgi:hypothetical protein
MATVGMNSNRGNYRTNVSEPDIFLFRIQHTVSLINLAATEPHAVITTLRLKSIPLNLGAMEISNNIVSKPCANTAQ